MDNNRCSIVLVPDGHDIQKFKSDLKQVGRCSVLLIPEQNIPARPYRPKRKQYFIAVITVIFSTIIIVFLITLIIYLFQKSPTETNNCPGRDFLAEFEKKKDVLEKKRNKFERLKNKIQELSDHDRWWWRKHVIRKQSHSWIRHKVRGDPWDTKLKDAKIEIGKIGGNGIKVLLHCYTDSEI